MNTNPVEVKHNPVVESAEARHSFRQEIERALDRLVHGLGGMPWQHFGHIDRLWPHGASVTLAIDVTENDKAYTVSAELPGIGEKDVHVTVRDRALLIEGEKRQDRTEEVGDDHFRERCYGSFKRALSLPDDVNLEKVEAAFAQGVLTVTLPKAVPSGNAQKIEIKAA